MPRRRIEPVDTIWLNMDRGDNLMVIESLMMTSSRVDPARLAAALEERVLSRYPVFHQRPTDSWLPWQLPRWEDDPDFDLARHLHVGRLPALGDDRVLQEYIAGQLNRELGRDRPLWEVHLLQGYGRGSAIYSRLHHSLADGIALTKVLLSLTDASSEGTLVADDSLEPHHHGWLELGGRLVGRFRTPRRTLATAGQAVALSVGATEVGAKLLFATNPTSPVNGTPGQAAESASGNAAARSRQHVENGGSTPAAYPARKAPSRGSPSMAATHVGTCPGWSNASLR